MTRFFDFLNLKATYLQGTARQTEAMAEASKFAGESLIRKEPEYLEGEPPKSPIEKKMEEMRRRQEFEKFKQTPLQSGHEPVVDYSQHLDPKLQEYTPKQPEYIPSLNPDDFNPFSPSRIDDMINAGNIQDTADSLTQTKEKIEIAKPAYTPKEPEYLEGTPTTQKSEAGSANQTDQRGIIVVGGKEESVAQRGIIIVGGKTDGTYFETIDHTVGKLNNNPAPETVQLFQQQVGALQDMSTTVAQSVQMNQQIASSFAARFRI